MKTHHKILTCILFVAFLNSCLVNNDNSLNRPNTNFDFFLLANTGNPIRDHYPYDRAKSLVGLKFAFRSTDYKLEVDSNIAAFQRETNRLPAMAGAYFDMSSQPKNLEIFLNAVRDNKAVPYVSLDPKDFDEPDIDLQKTFIQLIIKGEFDNSLKEWAQVFIDFNDLVLLRFGHEMNGNWYPYAGGGDGDGDGKPDGPAEFIKAWRHIYSLFEKEGVNNLLWIYCPAAQSFPKESWNLPFEYYPGHDFVDLIAVDAYEHYEKSEESLSRDLNTFYNELGLFYEEQWALGDSSLKPFGLGEFGTNRINTSLKADWYSEALQFLANDKRVQFHFLYNGKNGEDDFSIRGLGEKIQQAYNQARFQFNLF